MFEETSVFRKFARAQMDKTIQGTGCPNGARTNQFEGNRWLRAEGFGTMAMAEAWQWRKHEQEINLPLKKGKQWPNLKILVEEDR